jgi:hypothetical protein
MLRHTWLCPDGAFGDTTAIQTILEVTRHSREGSHVMARTRALHAGHLSRRPTTAVTAAARPPRRGIDDQEQEDGDDDNEGDDEHDDAAGSEEDAAPRKRARTAPVLADEDTVQVCTRASAPRRGD